MTSKSYAIIGPLRSSVAEVDRLLTTGAKELTLDFKDTTFISVEGLEWLEELLLRGESMQVKVTFSNIPTAIYKVFKVARIGKIVEACGMMPIIGPAC